MVITVEPRAAGRTVPGAEGAGAVTVRRAPCCADRDTAVPREGTGTAVRVGLSRDTVAVAGAVSAAPLVRASGTVSAARASPAALGSPDPLGARSVRARHCRCTRGPRVTVLPAGCLAPVLLPDESTGGSRPDVCCPQGSRPCPAGRPRARGGTDPQCLWKQLRYRDEHNAQHHRTRDVVRGHGHVQRRIHAGDVGRAVDAERDRLSSGHTGTCRRGCAQRRGRRVRLGR